MYVKKSNFVIYLALALVVGFGASFATRGLDVQSRMVSGDISKAAHYNKLKEDPSLTVVEERLRNDEEFLNRTKGAMGLLQNRMTVLSELTEKTMEVCSEIPEFEPLMTELQSLNARAFNTAQALDNANKGLDKVADGKNAPEYELYSNQAYIGFSKVESQMYLGEKFCRIASSFLEGKEEGQYQQVEELLAIWEVYCLQDSRMFADNKDRREPQTPPDTIPLHGTGLPVVKGPHGLGGLLSAVETSDSNTMFADNNARKEPQTPPDTLPLNSGLPGGPKDPLGLGGLGGLRGLRGWALNNSVLDEYLNGVKGLERIQLQDAFPGMEDLMEAPSIDGVGNIKNT